MTAIWVGIRFSSGIDEELAANRQIVWLGKKIGYTIAGVEVRMQMTALTYLSDAMLTEFSSVRMDQDPQRPCQSLENMLTPAAFDLLVRDFPRMEQFEKHEGLARANGQRPHDRYYLSYEASPYHPPGYQGPGVVGLNDLSTSWQAFIREMEGPRYRGFLKAVLGTDRFALRFAWHMGMTGAEVSPHKDNLRKLSIHLFYFNPTDLWDLKWGGEFLALSGRKVDRENPDFDDFDEVTPIPIVGNRSLLLKNSPDAWHGVRPLSCPEGQFRRLFTVIAEAPRSAPRKMLQFAKRKLGFAYPGEA